MTNPNSNIPPNPPETPETPNFLTRFSRFVRHPAVLITGGSLIVIGLGGYVGLRYFVYQQLPSLLESELGNTLEREVNIGEVESFSLNHLRIGTSEVPATSEDADTLSIKAIDVKYNIFPLLIGRPLPLDITLVEPNIYIEQDENGQWLDIPLPTDEPPPELPIKVDAQIKIENGDIALQAYQASKPLTLAVDGTARYTKTKEQTIGYDLDVDLLGSQISVQGNTVIETGKTELDLRVKRLALGELGAVLPNLPLQLDSGEIEADINVDVPSLDNIEGTQGRGRVNLSRIAGRIPALQVPIKANMAFSLEGQKLILDEFTASLSGIVAEGRGEIDWQEGYNLDIVVNPFNIDNLGKLLPFPLPVNLDGEIGAIFQVRGAVTEPIIRGKINSRKLLTIDKLEVQEFTTQFQTDFNKFTLQKLVIKPEAGGEISGQGQIELNILKSLEEDKPIDWQKMPLAFDFEAELPSQEIAASYVSFPDNVRVGDLSAEARIRGTLSEPEALIKWQSSQDTTVRDLSISGAGEFLLVGDNIIIRNTNIRSEQGTLTVQGTGNLSSKQWQSAINAQAFSLDPFIAILCENIAEICPYTPVVTPAILNQADIRLAGKLDDLDLDNIEAIANLGLSLNQGTVRVNSQLSQGNILAEVLASQLALDAAIPNLTVPVILQASRTNLATSVNDLLQQNWNNIQAKTDLRLTVAAQPVTIASTINQGIVNAVVNTQQIPVNQFIPNLTVPVSIKQTQVNLSAPIEQLLALDLSQLTATTNLRLRVADSPVDVFSRIENSILRAATQVRQLSLNKLIPEFPISTDIQTLQANLSGNVQNLLTSFLAGSPDLSSISSTVNLNLNVAAGTVITQTTLNNNQWRSKITASNINTPNLLQQLIPEYTIPNLPNSEAKIALSGNINSLLSPEAPFIINADNISVQAGEQKLNAKGDIVVTNLWTAPDASANLLMQAETDLSKLPLTAFLDLVPLERTFLPTRLDLEGKGQFQGRLVAKQILTAPSAPGNIQLNGQVEVANFAFNNRSFEPLLTGNLTVNVGQELNLNLTGNQDIIAAQLEPCVRNGCLAPYLPVSFQLQRTDEEEKTLIVQGQRQGDRLLTRVENFALDWLQISPAVEYGMAGFLEGNVNLNLDLNLFTLAGRGQLQVVDIGLGNIKADALNANFVYQDQLAELTAATLDIGRNKLAVEGFYNLRNNAIQALANIDQGYIEDIITALGVPDIHTLILWAQLQQVNYTKANLIPLEARGDINATLAAQINLRDKLEKQIQELARQRQQFGVPTELDIRGTYSASLSLAGNLRDGTLKNPQAEVRFQGQRWSWYPHLPYPDIVEPLGLVMISTEMVPIKRINFHASLEDILQIKTASISIQDSRLFLEDTRIFIEDQANLIPNLLSNNLDGNIEGVFGIENLSLDTFAGLIRVPVDLDGNLNLAGNLSQTIREPQITGEFKVIDLAYSGRLLEQDVTGSFNYNTEDTKNQLQILTDESSFIYLNAKLPYPPQQKENEQIEIEAQLGTEALELVNIFTQEQVSWLGGEGEVNITLTLPIQWLEDEEGFTINLDQLIAMGNVTLTDATLQSATFPDILTVNGQIDLIQEQLNVRELTASFADSEIKIQGILPIFTPSPSPLSNPLTVAIEKGKINLENLYRGNLDGNIVITGIALQPIITGEVKLSQGQVFIPRATDEITPATPVGRAWLGAANTVNFPLIPKLDNFNVILESLSVSQDPLYNFSFGGELMINGELTPNLNTLQPQGIITLDRGAVNYLEGRFLLNRRHRNQIVFDPIQGILNPEIDIQMRTIASDFPEARRERRTDLTNEIPDESLSRVRRIDITLAINGRLSQLFPAFGRDADDICQIFTHPEPIRQLDGFSQQQLDQLATCVQFIATAMGENEPMIHNSAIQLTSSPPRSEGEIIRLLGDQLFVIADSLQGKNTAQLLEYGVLQLAVPLILQDLAYDVETAVANALNMTDFRALPFLEAVYSVDKRGAGFIRISYDYNFNEVTVKYETSF